MLPCTSQNSLISPSNSALAMYANVALKSSSLSRHDTWPYLGPPAPICQWFPAFVTPVKRPFVGSINPSLSPVPQICEPPELSAFSRPSSSTTRRVPLLPLLLFHIYPFPQELLVLQKVMMGWKGKEGRIYFWHRPYNKYQWYTMLLQCNSLPQSITSLKYKSNVFIHSFIINQEEIAHLIT